MFRCILALALGKSIREIGKLDSREISDWKWFYSRCPFGPARQDINAWLTANNVLLGWSGKGKSMADAMLWLGGKVKRKPKPKPQGNLGRKYFETFRAKMEELKSGLEK